MNSQKKIALEQNRAALLQDLSDITDILIHLSQKNILNREELERITCSNEKAPLLVEILLNKSDDVWFDEFLLSLEKDYNWLSEKIKKTYEKNPRKDFYLYTQGNVPLPPSHHVSRSNYLECLRQEIRQLQKKHYLVVHGISGCGKSCLAADALDDLKFLEEVLHGNIFWLPVGELKPGDTEDLQCQQLQKSLCDMAGVEVNSQRELLIQLKHYFSKNNLEDSLLVLDDVTSTKVIKALDVGCKVMITTNDCDVMKGIPVNRCKEFHIKDGFTESETVQLLRDFILEGNGELIPAIKRMAQQIHQVWRGQPMLIGLIGGDLAEDKENAKINQLRWCEYIQSPLQSENDAKISHRRSIIEQQMSALIDKTVNKLDKELKKQYLMLAVFVEDANITTDVLKTLWDKEEYPVSLIMKTFMRRNLVMKKHTPSQGWIYGIHDLLMGHLKKMLSTQELLDMHRDFLTKYLQKCDNNFAQLPYNDNYIYSYVCHHIENASAWNEYRDQIFSLPYIESKLRATGPGDLLLDLCKYENSLVDNKIERRKKIKDLRKFVENSGWAIHKHQVDALQCALLEPQDSDIRSQAVTMLEENKKIKLYFHPVNNPKEKPKELQITYSEVRAVCAIPASSSESRVLISSGSQGVREVDMSYQKPRREFPIELVNILIISPNKSSFLSASETGSIQVWSLYQEGKLSANTPPPSLRQRDYTHLSPASQDITSSYTVCHTRRVICASFSRDGRQIVSASEDGYVKVSNVEERTELVNIRVHPSPSPVSCTFTGDDSMIVYGCPDHAVYFYHLSMKKQIHYQVADRKFGLIVSILCEPGVKRKLIVVMRKAVQLWSWEDEVLKHETHIEREIMLRGMKQLVFYHSKSEILCGTYSDCCLVLGTQKGCVFFHNPNFNEEATEGSWILISPGPVKSVSVLRDRLVFTTGDTVKLCWPDVNNGGMPQDQLTSTHLGWNSKLSITASCFSNGNIQVWQDGKIKMEKLCTGACIVRVSEYGNHVLVGTENGGVLLCDLGTGFEHDFNANLPSKVTYLRCGMSSRDSVSIAAVDPNSSNDLTLVILKFNYPAMKCHGLKSPLVETFICDELLLGITQDYAVLVWDLSRGQVRVLQDGRINAKVRCAYLSKEKDLLVLSDEEHCFHTFRIRWPSRSNNIVPILQNLSITSKRPLNLSLSNTSNINHIPLYFRPSNEEGSCDNVDGACISSPEYLPILEMSTYPLDGPTWCCCVSSDAKLIVLGYSQKNILVWDVVNHTPVGEFCVPGNAKVSHVMLSKVNVTDASFKLTLLAVSDCLSWWDMSQYVSVDVDNISARSPQHTETPPCLSCVKVSDLPIVDVSADSTFSKFSVVDSSGICIVLEQWNNNS